MQHEKYTGIRELIAKIMQNMAKREYSTKSWKANPLHPQESDEVAVEWIFLIDLLNFSFWSSGEKVRERYTVSYRGVKHTGYWSLCAVIRRALDENVPILDASFWVDASIQQLRHLFRPNKEGMENCPLLDKRIQILKDAGKILLTKYDGKFINVIKRANKSAQSLLELLVADFDYIFRDIHVYKGKSVKILKRAQILVADLWACFDGKNWGEFQDIDSITMFADYRVPQGLLELGVMSYSPYLLSLLQNHEKYHTENIDEDPKNYDDSSKYLPSGSDLELEIRGNSIHAVELIVKEIKSQGRNLNAILIDFYLWDLAKEMQAEIQDHVPFHRTRSIYY